MSRARIRKQMVYRRTARSETIRAAARARILSAARKLFAKHGYDETTMQEIVREAGTSIGNAYFYFSNKEDLLTSLLEDTLHSTWARADVLIDSVEPGAAQVAVAVYSNIIHLLTSERDLTQIAVTGAPRAVRRVVDLSLARLMAFLAANFPGRSRKEHLMTAVAIGGANRTAIELCLTGELDVPPRELAEFLVRWHLRAFGVPEGEITRVLRVAARTIKGEAAVNEPRARRKASRAKVPRG